MRRERRHDRRAHVGLARGAGERGDPPGRAEAGAATLPHRSKYLLLTIGFLRRLLQLHLDWIDEVERELADDDERDRPDGRSPDAGRGAAGGRPRAGGR